jgi:TonB family protein
MKDGVTSLLPRRTIAHVGLLVALMSSPAVSAQHRGDPLSGALDAKGVRYRGSDYIGPVPWMKDRIKIVPLKYPYEARTRHIQGSGLFRLSLDLNTGSVSKVTVVQSTGSPMLDNYTSDMLHRWPWKPGRWLEVDYPVTFTMSPRHNPKAEAYIASPPVSR